MIVQRCDDRCNFGNVLFLSFFGSCVKRCSANPHRPLLYATSVDVLILEVVGEENLIVMVYGDIHRLGHVHINIVAVFFRTQVFSKCCLFIDS